MGQTVRCFREILAPQRDGARRAVSGVEIRPVADSTRLSRTHLGAPLVDSIVDGDKIGEKA